MISSNPLSQRGLTTSSFFSADSEPSTPDSKIPKGTIQSGEISGYILVIIILTARLVDVFQEKHTFRAKLSEKLLDIY